MLFTRVDDLKTFMFAKTSDVLILSDHGDPSSNWAAEVVELYGGILGKSSIGGDQDENGGMNFGSEGRADLIVADQRNSQFGDINAGTMIVRVSEWSLRFLEAWWNHDLAQQVRK